MNLVLDYAKSELDKYHKLINNDFNHEITLTLSKDFADFNSDCDFELDDAYYIDIKEAKGKILGVNPRSVLIGVYKYFCLLGCVFYAPGECGEIVIQRGKEECTVNFTGIASNRHRGICIEGSVSYENVLDMVDFAPKNGFNSYFIQFREGHNFFERWYTHEGNTLLKPEEYSVKKSQEFVKKLEIEIKRRGLLYHKIGHGWTCECLGYPSTGWHKIDKDKVPEITKKYLAEIAGERNFYEDVPLNTHLCYSNPEVRRLIVDEVVKYTAGNPYVDVLHFWLADNFNNICECENCKEYTITDLYVKMLNDIDERLTSLNIKTKIVFLIYFELLWEPINEKINNPDRFIMMFAPITRTYTRGYLVDNEVLNKYNTPQLEYHLNKMVFPKDVESNLAMLFRWQKHFNKDSFVFDYHLMWDIYRDFSGMELARVIYSDVKSLKTIGLNGMISCQVNRASFPTSFCMYVMGKMLYDNQLEYEDIKNEYFTSVFGEKSDVAINYLQGLSQKISFKYNRGELNGYVGNEYVLNLKGAKDFINKMSADIILAYEDYKGTQQERAWRNLKYSTDIYLKAVEILIQKASGADTEHLKSLSSDFSNYIWSIEPILQKDLDVFFFNMITTGIFIDEKIKMDICLPN
jgi:hypothetical protein